MRKCGCVDTLCFGAETDNLSLLKEVASLLVSEPEDYKEVLSSCLKKECPILPQEVRRYAAI